MSTSFWADGADRLRTGLRARRRELDRLTRELREARSEAERIALEERIRTLLEEADLSEEELDQAVFIRHRA